MIQIIYFALLSCVVGYFLFLLGSNTRRAIIAGLTFTSLALSAIPWQFVKIPSLGVALNMGFILLALLYTATKRAFSTRAFVTPYNTLLYFLALLLFAFTIVSDAQAYGLSKSAFFVVKVVLPMTAFSLMAPFSDVEKKTIVATLVVASILTAVSLFAFSTFNPHGLYERATVGGDKLNPITVSRTIGFGTVVLFLFGLNFKSGRLGFVSTLLLAVVTILGIVATGSRGPLFAALGATVISLFTINSSLSNSLRTFSKLAILGVIIVAAFSMLDVQEKLENMGGYRRISLYLSETGTNTSDLERIRRFDTAWTNIVKSGGLGIGTGGFASLYGYEFREYPHNVFLEVVLELGVLGFAVLMGLVAVVLLMMYRRRKMARTSFYIQGLFGLWLYSMFNAMVSGDIASNEALWVFGGLTVLSLLDLGRYPSRTERRAA